MKTISCMNIDQQLLRSFGGDTRSYKAKDTIFKEGDHVQYYFQIVKGKIKLNTYDEEGREFIHNILGINQSFGDSLLFLEKRYPVNAVCLELSELIRVPKNNFLDMIRKHPDLSLSMNACLSQRIYFKVLMMKSMSSQNPESRLKGLLDYLKSYHDGDCIQCFPVELTRQQMANLVGLRVETVIRALKKMEKKGEIRIKNRKILY
ncbi:MAG: Crp/Fnr family transcriptional regulator [Chryseobacterium sp.]|jgi:CRP-like cAMP-binding protein|uniref:Crp/Fnr family transcriptional regulator n=1 Tax=Chryseobacterium sp. TaxID=1871047 RepID=UPI002827BAC9|nr:Crp/Fnr family transcriptional regulator [Chryseobacterium sp.]MDR2235865.1 Crp/Fnr family transcriptional regulator [Chryseobacterium sp.]